MPLQQSFVAMLISGPNPRVNPGPIDLQTSGNLTAGLSLDAEHDGLESQGHTGRFVGLGFLAKSFEPLKSS